MSKPLLIDTVDDLVLFVTPYVREGIRIQQHCDLVRLTHTAECRDLHCSWPHAKCPANNCRYVAGEPNFLDGPSWPGCDGHPHVWNLDDSSCYTRGPTLMPILQRSSAVILEHSSVFPDRTMSLPTIKEDLLDPPELVRNPSKDYTLSDASTQLSGSPPDMEDLE